jgi:ADP-ribose pyrophosphatase YjhB (NUDIX family)
VTEQQFCAGGIVHDAAARVLLIRRGRPPSEGSWSIPGGRLLPGESAAAACVREVGEETGVRVEVVRLAGRVERPAPGGGVYVIDDFLCRWVAGVPVAADDARDARWFTRREMHLLDLAPGVYDALDEWGLLPD